MKKVKFSCEIITPMFMYGADKNILELRPSEFKGMLRFWWRAIKAEDKIEELKKEEAKIFGGTEQGEGRSRVRIKTYPLKIKEGWYWPLPHKKNFRNKCYLSGSTFRIDLICENNYKELIKNLFVLATILGSFGKRARRGFGSIQISNFYEEINLQNIVQLLNKIKNSYQYRDDKIVNLKGQGNYPWIKKIEIGKDYKNVENLLEKIGQSSHNFKDPCLGNANPRMASPIYVSILRIKNFYKPIITTLNSSFPKRYPKWNFSNQEKFKKEILDGRL